MTSRKITRIALLALITLATELAAELSQHLRDKMRD
jgi:hypothetical protein